MRRASKKKGAYLILINFKKNVGAVRKIKKLCIHKNSLNQQKIDVDGDTDG